MSARGVINTLPEKIKADTEDEFYRNYIARCARLLTENTGKMALGGYITTEYDDIIHPKNVAPAKAEEIIEDIISRSGIEVINK